MWTLTLIIVSTLLITLHTATAGGVSNEWCLERGFDPSNLSCDTCQLLAESTTLQQLQDVKNKASDNDDEHIDINKECRACCQEYKVNPVLRPGETLKGKYKHAILKYDEKSVDNYQEVKDFVERDLSDVLSFKGDKFQIEKTNDSSPNNNIDMYSLMMGGVGFGGGPPKLMFFEQSKKEGYNEEEAGEVINLRGWKREDISNMLLTLLPNA